MKIRGAIFDLDGTLLDSMYVWGKVDNDFLGKRGIEIPDDYSDSIIHMTFVETARYTIERFSLPDTPRQVMDEWNDMAYEEYAEKVMLKDGVYEALNSLSERGVKLGIATSNIAKLYEPCLKRNGIYDLFDSFTETDEIGKGKREPDIYLIEAGKMKVSPGECLVFEDIPTALQSAGRGGFTTVGVWDESTSGGRKEFEESCDMVLWDWSEACDRLDIYTGIK